LSAGESYSALTVEKPAVCRDIHLASALHVLLAMQKVEGSNPFSRSLGSGSTEPQTVSLSEVADFVTASLRVMPRRALDKGYTFRFPELEPALRDLLGK
jgi:Domain of unknown function (DUF1731)